MMYRSAARLGLKPLDLDAMSLGQWLAFVSGHAGEEQPDSSWSAEEYRELLQRHGH